MESCELHLIHQPFRLLEIRSYALNCAGIKDGNVLNSYVPAKGAPVSPYQLSVGNVPAFFMI